MIINNDLENKIDIINELFKRYKIKKIITLEHYS